MTFIQRLDRVQLSIPLVYRHHLSPQLRWWEQPHPVLQGVFHSPFLRRRSRTNRISSSTSHNSMRTFTWLLHHTSASTTTKKFRRRVNNLIADVVCRTRQKPDVSMATATPQLFSTSTSPLFSTSFTHSRPRTFPSATYPIPTPANTLEPPCTLPSGPSSTKPRTYVLGSSTWT
ncbi:hypothetical protein BDN72DRAFT_677939 [Pluteus cervinus]|uniref:Uncharacterized protein n=1 Tax=Pluteus cervinus TaxID=181527 RepID=A0ACD2ZZ03_9AGAR|nr:hypothetical protein BDN72DRAFT_677939 [Pluteus cervinus]